MGWKHPGVGFPGLDRPPIPVDAFLDKPLFLAAWNQPFFIDSLPHWRAALVNHHVLASETIAHLFKTLAQGEPNVETIIILSPDHYAAGASTISVGETAYKMNGDLVAIDEPSITRLKNEAPFVQTSASLFLREHGVGALIPFLHRAWPQAMVVPIAIRPDVSESEAKLVSAWLRDEIGRGARAIVSSDMSHYLSKTQADQKDKETEEALQVHNKIFFWKSSFDHLDNGKGIWMLLSSIGSSTWHMLEHKNSANFGASPGVTTSYLTGYWE